jgi:TatD DNase family protein
LDRVVGIGEIGLDFYRNPIPVEDQERCFVRFVELAKEINKPIILHIRDAYAEVIEILRKVGIPKAGGVVHSFLSNYEDARKFMDMGLHIGIGGPLTFKKNDPLRETVKRIPIEKIVSETDCPYLTPAPYRGKRNQPLYVQFVVEAISTLKQLSPAATREILCQNAVKLFSLPDL